MSVISGVVRDWSGHPTQHPVTPLGNFGRTFSCFLADLNSYQVFLPILFHEYNIS